MDDQILPPRHRRQAAQPPLSRRTPSPALCFAARIAKLLHDTSHLSPDGATRTYHVRGQLFFASTTAFFAAFDLREKLAKVVLDVTHAHF